MTMSTSLCRLLFTCFPWTCERVLCKYKQLRVRFYLIFPVLMLESSWDGPLICLENPVGASRRAVHNARRIDGFNISNLTGAELSVFPLDDCSDCMTVHRVKSANNVL